MRIIGFGSNTVTVELDTGDAFLLAEACHESAANEYASNNALTDLMAQTLIAAAMAAATWDRTTGNQGCSIDVVRGGWVFPDKD